MTDTDSRLHALLDEPVARALRRAAGETPCHLVGGVLRDRLLDLPGSDYDAVVAGRGEELGRRLAADLPARLVHLGGRSFAAYRLVGDGLTLDLWDRGGNPLAADLARRDFTVNAIALDVASRRTTDPFAGLADLRRRRLRATGPTVLAADPLRVLRLARLLVQLPGFGADAATVEQGRSAAAGLAGVAAERVREELGKLLAARRFAPGFELLVEMAVYPGLLVGRPGEPGDARRARRRLLLLEGALEDLRRLGRPPRGRLEPAEPRLAALISGLAEDPAAGETELETCRRAGYLTNRQTDLSRRLLACDRLPRDEAAMRWLLHRWGADWPAAAAALAALPEPPPARADWRGLVARLTELAAGRAAAEIFAPEALLDGRQIGRLLGLEPGRRLGRAVALLNRAQVEGRVTDRAAAEALLRSSASGAD